MTLAVFRLLKARYALALAQRLLSADAGGSEDVRRAAVAVTARADRLRAWVERGSPLEPSPGIDYPGHEGVPLPDEVWDAVDVLVPTRFHDDLGLSGEQRALRHEVFHDLWLAAENAKIDLGTPAADGSYPSAVRPVPPARLVDLHGIGAGGLDLDLGPADVRPHLEPPLRQGLAIARAALREAQVERVDFFVLAGNACRLPLVRSLFQEEMAAAGARGAENVLFDPDVAKTAVAMGACLLAVHETSDAGVLWSFEQRDDRLRDFIGRLDGPGLFRKDPRAFHEWFRPGQSLPARTRVRLPAGAARVDVFGVRRHGGDERWLGRFALDDASTAVQMARPPEDFASALSALPLQRTGRPDGPDVVDVLLTDRQRLYLGRGGAWFAMRTVRHHVPDEHNPFSGTH
jgi:hypothetical protein